MKTVLYLSIILILISCKNDNSIDIEGRNGKLYHNGKTDLIIRDYNKTNTLIIEGIELKNNNKPLNAIQKFNLAEKNMEKSYLLF